MLIREGILTERLHTIYYLTHEYDPENAAFNRAKEMPDKVKIHLSTKVTEITEKGIKIVDQDGNESFIEADNVIISVGMKSRAAEAATFDGIAFDVINVGDSLKASTIYHAVTTSFDAALTI